MNHRLKLGAISVAATFAALLAVEVVLRLVWHNPFLHEEPDKLLKVAIQHPNTLSAISRSPLGEDGFAQFRTDQRSYILPSGVSGASPDDLRIAFLGGSTTACHVVEEENRFPAQVEVILRARGFSVDTLNAARAGGTVHDSINVFLNHVIEDRPEIVVLMHATNDAGVLANDRSYRRRSGVPVDPSRLITWGTQIASSKSSLVGSLRSLATVIKRQKNASRARIDSVLIDQGIRESQEFQLRLRLFVAMTKAAGAIPVLMTQPLSPIFTPQTPRWANTELQEHFNQTVRRVALETSSDLIDLDAALREKYPETWMSPGFVFYDSMHVTDAGSRIYAEIISDELEAVLQKIPAEQEQDRGVQIREGAAQAPPAQSNRRSLPSLPLQEQADGKT